MKISKLATLILMGVAGVLVMVNCKQQSATDPAPQAGVAEQSGAALDAAAAKPVAGADQAAEKTGDALEKAGAAVEQTGENLQN